MNSLQKTQLGPYSNYDLLRVYTFYRAVLGTVLLAMFQINVAPSILGDDNPALFFYTSLIYTGLNIFTVVLLWRARFQPSQEQLFAVLLIDVIALTLLMHASGGALSGMGYLLLAATAAGGILLTGRLAVALAAVASIAVIAESLSRLMLVGVDNQTLFAAGSLGALIFITAIAFQYLNRRLRTTHAEAQAQARQAAHLQRLAQQVVEEMRTGLIAINEHGEIELINRAACQLLGLEGHTPPADIEALPAVADALKQWQASQEPTALLYLDGAPSAEIKLSFTALEAREATGTLAFVEDNREITQQAQRLKLASLGRLTASIAHEIRNPLGAISHASQLLGESDSLDTADRRLLTIIDNHSTRVNHIIENVMQLSRRRTAQPAQIDLSQWLVKFKEDYQNACAAEPLRIAVNTPGEPLLAKFDPSQLYQVMSNLCDNALRYGADAQGRVHIALMGRFDVQRQRPSIDVLDAGPGIEAEKARHIFEPFFTTGNTGSGLGLYICKELCEANRASIDYQRNPRGGSRFRILLATTENQRHR
ncbi:sensor histidine kinase [Marinimicrobium alkaliphilum]|uniref:sensor histidine kinase n=1 Tax=Marinimicrobium alkaliphilum TaxID=2202654 RepID=UPI000DB9B763|nr:PAS domain-containing sensor histidine kinase [Marinimicrobium alkaliphilum]